MCEFVSWIECTDKDDVVHRFWLTEDLIYHTKRGRELQKYCQISQDLVGHGAIERYYGIKGKHCECTDFSDPKNFPNEIVADIKAGKMRGVGMPTQMLTDAARDEYEKVCNEERPQYDKVYNAARAKYNKICNKVWAKCKKICDKAQAQYDEVCDEARAKYNDVCDEARDKYDEVCSMARAQCKKICNEACWDLFANPKNRIEAWR
jgi:hypothetical protein